MAYSVRFTPQARADLVRLYGWLLDRATAVEDLETAERALDAIQTAIDVHLARTPFIYRRASSESGLRRELIIPFGSAGYVALYEIVAPGEVLVLAVRHQREEDYY